MLARQPEREQSGIFPISPSSRGQVRIVLGIFDALAGKPERQG